MLYSAEYQYPSEYKDFFKLDFFIRWDREVISGHGMALEAASIGRAEEAAEAGKARGSGPGLRQRGLMTTGPGGGARGAAVGIRTSGMRSAAAAAAWALVLLGSGAGGGRFNCSHKILSLYSFIFFEL